MSENRQGLALTLISIFLLIAFVLAVFICSMTAPRIMSAKELVNNGARTFEQAQSISAFEMVSHENQAFTKDNFNDRWTLLFFGFSHCGSFCPTTLAILDQLIGQLEADIADQTQVVMVSVDPERDTPAVLTEYLSGFNPAFIGITGEFISVKLLSDQF